MDMPSISSFHARNATLSPFHLFSLGEEFITCDLGSLHSYLTPIQSHTSSSIPGPRALLPVDLSRPHLILVSPTSTLPPFGGYDTNAVYQLYPIRVRHTSGLPSAWTTRQWQGTPSNVRHDRPPQQPRPKINRDRCLCRSFLWHFV